ncbi:MAG: sigma-70 family RNA polymerase sigma factor [Planctomycetota bacterium]|nr:sigma-70 family RNA polymerase sigma factor [Planctomycetota bacterium]
MHLAEPEWTAFFERYRPLALRIAAGLVGADLGEEVVQEAARHLIVRARREPPLADVTHARNHFLQAVRHQAVSRLRAEVHRQGEDSDLEPADPAASGASAIADAEELHVRAARLEVALDQLGDEEREALDLRYRQGLAYPEMAARTGRAVSTLQARVEAALRKTRDRLGIPHTHA